MCLLKVRPSLPQQAQGQIPIQADNLTELKTSEKKLIQKWSVAQTKKKFIETRKVLTKKLR